ncbi:MAG: hypothetical protein JSS27_12560 [Planctomycetes bacterium]|nr:hypothetical protein [Planctomycetota bacterium]
MTLRLVILFVLAVVTAGCRNGATQELLERDLRRQEDRIYELEDKLQDQCDLVEATRRENDALRAQVGREATSPSDDTPRRGNGGWRPRGEGGRLLPPSVKLPEPAQAFEGPPEIRAPNAKTPEGEAPRPSPAPLNAPQVDLPEVPQGAQHEHGPKLNSTAEVMAITLHQQQSGGVNLDGRPGDDGIAVLVEPRAVDGQLVDKPASISIVLLDPTNHGPEARLARWDFAAADVAKRWSKLAESTGDAPPGNEPTAGYKFSMRWTGPPPRHKHLSLNVRYTTTDGRKLDASLPVEIELPNAGPMARSSQSPGMQQSTTHTGPMTGGAFSGGTASGGPMTGGASSRGGWTRPIRPAHREREPQTTSLNNDRPMIVIEPPETPPADREPRTARDPREDRTGWKPYR